MKKMNVVEIISNCPHQGMLLLKLENENYITLNKKHSFELFEKIYNEIKDEGIEFDCYFRNNYCEVSNFKQATQFIFQKISGLTLEMINK